MSTNPSDATPPNRQHETLPPHAITEGSAPDTEQSPYGTLAQSPEDQHRAAAVSSSYGVNVPGFQIEGELGRGGMGVVFRARQILLNRVVALKMVIAGSYSDTITRTRFLLEAESVAALEHPNIVKVYSFGEHDEHPFLAMEYLPGGSLADRVKARGPLPPREATALVANLAAAVAHAHSRGVVHRDIKPANVLLTADGDPRLTDFGLAKVGRSDLSVTGQVLGTPAYMAPEQASGKVHAVGTPADVYALGAVLYDLLTGRPPFAGNSAAATIHMVLASEPERLRKHDPAVPRDLETICLKCLEKEPEKRYPTAQAVADDLNRFLCGDSIMARPAGSLERAVKWMKRNRGLSVGIAVATLALLAGVTASLWFGLWAMTEAERATNEADRAKGKADDERRAREQAAVSERRALAALGEAQSQRIKADRKQAELEFGHAMTSCEEGRVQAGLEMFVRVVELAEANALAQEPGDVAKEKASDRELSRVARLNLASWVKVLPPPARAFPHPAEPAAVEFFPDGKQLVTSGVNSQVILWDTATGEKLRTYNTPRTLRLPGMAPGMGTVAVSPDGKTIVTGSGAGQIVVWDASNPNFKLAFDGTSAVAKTRDGNNIFSIAFAPDGTLWAADGDNGIHQWDLAAQPKPKLLARLVPPQAPNGGVVINVLALSTDGKFAYTGDRAGLVHEWNLQTRQPGRAWAAAGWVQDLAVSPDGTTLAATGPGGRVRVFDIPGRRPTFDIDLAGSNGNGVAFAPQQPILVTADNDGNIRYWHQHTGQPVGVPLRVTSDPRRPRFRPGTDQFAVTSGNASYVCTIPQPARLVTARQGSRVRGLDCSPTGDRLAVADDFQVEVFDIKTLKSLQISPNSPQIIRSMRYDADPKRSRVFRGYISAFDLLSVPNGPQSEIKNAFGLGQVRRFEFSPGGSNLYVLGDTLLSRLAPGNFDVLGVERPIKDLPPGVTAGVMAVRPDGGELLVTSGPRVVFLNPETLKASRTGWATADEVRDAQYTRDGLAILVGRRDNVAELLDATTGRPLIRQMPHDRAVASVATSPDGKFLATGSRDNTARFWDSKTGLPVGPPLRHQSEVIHVVFEPNASRLATGTGGGHVTLWDVPPPAVTGSVEELRSRFARPAD
ncbi:MAG: hypothetical protein C0467_24135 [Planctomycetaceae bacterium]|nr:hypothetical protein [Planctomycetaceae bacterium]